MNAIFQVIQNLLRRKEHKARCPGCGRAASAGEPGEDAHDADQADAPGPEARRCPECGRPLPGQDAS